MSFSETDACRFTVVIEEAIQRLELLRCLQKHVQSDQVGNRSAAARATMMSLLNTQSEMQKRYTTLSKSRQSSKANKDDELSRRKDIDLEHELHDTVENLRYCRRSIAKAMGAEDPEHVRKLGEITTQCSGLIDQLKQLVFDLSEPERTFTSLSEKVRRCLSQDRQLKETLQRQSAAETQRRELEAELQQIEDQFAERNADIDAAITELTAELKKATDDLAVQAKLETDISKASINTVERLRQNELESIRYEIARCEADTEQEAKVSAKTKEFLERQIENNRAKLATWETKFAEELAEKKEELQQIKSQYTEAKEQLDQLEARWKLEQENEERLAREAEAARVQAEKNEAVQRLEDAASTIQKAWRTAKQKRTDRAAQKKKKKSGKSKSGKATKKK